MDKEEMDMPAGKYDLLIEQGATYDKTVIWKDSNRNPIDLTLYTASMQIRESVDAISTIASSTGTSPTITIIIGGISALGTIQILIDASTTASFNFDTAVYDLDVTTGTTVKRLLEGEVKLSKEVTR